MMNDECGHLHRAADAVQVMQNKNPAKQGFVLKFCIHHSAFCIG